MIAKYDNDRLTSDSAIMITIDWEVMMLYDDGTIDFTSDSSASEW